MIYAILVLFIIGLIAMAIDVHFYNKRRYVKNPGMYRKYKSVTAMKNQYLEERK